MKLIHLKLKRECVLVELPEGEKNIRIGDWGNFVYDNPMAGEFTVDMLVPLGSDFMGKLSDLTEQQFEGLVHRSSHHSDLYKSYNACDVRPYSYARESFISAIEAEGWYTENPYGKYEAKNTSQTELEEEARSYDLWKKAQEKVIDLSNSYIFIKEEA